MSSERPLTEYEEGILANVEQFGVHLTTVSADPPFTYSAGFMASYGCPEAITFGLGYGTMASMINRLGDACRDGLVIKDELVLDGILDHFPVVVRVIPPERIVRDYFNSSMWLFHRNSGESLTQAVQVVWPCDRTGKFPWEAGCPPDVIACQPTLYTVGSVH